MSEQGDVTSNHQREKLQEELLHSQGQLQEGLLEKKDDKSGLQQKPGEMHQMGQPNTSNQNPSNLASPQTLVTHHLPLQGNYSFPLQLLHNSQNSGQHGLVGENFLDTDPNRGLYGQTALQMFIKKLPGNKQEAVVGSPNSGSPSPVDPLKKKGRGGKRAGAGRKRKRQDAPPGTQTMNSVSTGDPSALLNAGSLGHPANNSPNFKQLSSPQQAPVSPRAVGSTSSTLPASAAMSLGLTEDETIKQILQGASNFNQQAVHKQLGRESQPGHESPSKQQRRQEELHKLEEEKTELESRYRDLNAVLTINANLNYGLTNRVKALEVQVKELQLALQNKEETERSLLLHKKELERKIQEMENELSELKSEKK